MRIFNKGENSYDEAVNFVDMFNVFVGYDTRTDCCEYASWYIIDKETNEPSSEHENYDEKDLEAYYFDVEYFQELDLGGYVDEGGAVRFKLLHPTKDPKYLVIFNAHNGYYGHGFSFQFGDQMIQTGCL